MTARRVVYALIGEDGICLYVGQTTTPAKREHTHRNLHSSPFRGGNWRMVILFQTHSPEEGAEHESKWIAHYKSLGQAAGNRTCKGGVIGCNKIPTHVCVETGELFYGMVSVSQFIGFSVATVSKYFEEAEGTGGLVQVQLADYSPRCTEIVHLRRYKLGEKVSPVVDFQI